MTSAIFNTCASGGNSIGTLVAVEGIDGRYEDSFETAKNEFGIDHNESRSGMGWTPYVSLVSSSFAMMARSDIALIRPRQKNETAPPGKSKAQHPTLIVGQSRKSAASAIRLVESGFQPAHLIAWSLCAEIKASCSNAPNFKSKKQL